jgi:hypothetical protein
MKKILYTLILLFSCINLIAQVPQKMSYQTVVRNSSNQLVNNQQVGIKISLLQGSTTGAVVFSQTFTPTTNANGLATLVIGDTSAAYNSINWAVGSPYFIKTEVDPTGGTNYTIEATSELMSVPYAMVAGSVVGLGRESVYIYDENINNNDIANILSLEVGPITQKIDIRDVKNVTSINLNKIKLNKVLYSLNASSLLDTFLCDNVEKVLQPQDGYSTFTILSKYTSMKNLKRCHNLYCTGLSSNSMPNLEQINNPNWFSSNGSSTLRGTDLNFPKLTAANDINFKGNSLYFPLLKTANNANLFGNTLHFPLLKLKSNSYASFSGQNVYFPMIDSLYSLDFSGIDISFPALKHCMRFMHNYYDSFKLNSLKFPQLNTIGESLILGSHNGTDTLISLPVLVYAGSIWIQRDTALKTIHFPLLKNVNGTGNSGVKIDNNPNLETLIIDSLIAVDLFAIKYNPKLNYIKINSNLKLTGNSGLVEFNNNNFNSSTINQILKVMLSNNNYFYFYDINLSGQNPPAPPTGQGIIDKQVLISLGKNVLTD